MHKNFSKSIVCLFCNIIEIITICNIMLHFIGIGAISWSRMTDDIPETKKEAKDWFGELAMALTTLYCHNNSWTENDTINIIEELFSEYEQL